MFYRPNVIDMDSNDFDYFGFSSDKQGFYNVSADPVSAIAEGVGKIADSVGSVATARSNRKVAESKLSELGGKRSAQLKDCENNKAFKKFLDGKYRRSRIAECQVEVNNRISLEEKEQQEIVRKSLEIEQGKVGTRTAEIESTDKKKYIYIVIGVVGLIGIIYLITKNK